MEINVMNLGFLKQSLVVMSLITVANFPSFAMERQQEDQLSNDQMSHYRRTATPLFYLSNDLNLLKAHGEGCQFVLKGLANKVGMTAEHLFGEPLCGKIHQFVVTTLDLSLDAEILGNRINDVRSEKINDENQLIKKINEAILHILGIDGVVDALDQKNIDEKFLDNMSKHLPNDVRELRTLNRQLNPLVDLSEHYLGRIFECAKKEGIPVPNIEEYFKEDLDIMGEHITDIGNINTKIQSRIKKLEDLAEEEKRKETGKKDPRY
jgi:hypothetical protein